MPEFRRGWGRWLPRAAERDLFHPSLEDLRAERARGVRLQLAIAALWLECWRVWLFADRPARAGRYINPQRSHIHERGPRRREFMAILMQDVRRALRLFRMEPGFSAAAVLTLALGIGANTALFAVVEAALLRPLSVSGAGDLVVVRHRAMATGATKEFLATGDFFDLRDRQRSLEQVAAYGGAVTTLYGDGEEPMRVEGLGASPELLSILRAQPAMGRLLEPGDMKQGAPPVVIISHELWTNRFASDPNILSRSIQMGNARRLVVGVMQPGFHYPPGSATHIIVPMVLPATPPAQRQAGWIPMMGRLKAGQTLESANAEFAALSAEFEQRYPDQNRGTQYYVVSLRDELVGDTKRPLLLLFAAVGFVLLIACVNVGNLLLARSLGRRQEMAVRTALGAGRGRLVSQVMSEALVLALAGGIVGVILSTLLAPALAGLLPETTRMRVPGLREVGLNLPVALFSVGASAAAALLFGAVACLSFTSAEQRSALAVTRGTTMSGSARRAASTLVVAEIALAGVLLVGAGLTLRSFANLIAVDPGFQTGNVLLVNVTLPGGRYPTPAARADLYQRAFDTLEALPEVDHAGVAQVVPLTGNNWTVPFERVDRPAPAGVRAPDVGWQAATDGFFQALNIPLRAGRLFEDRDVAAAVAPVIISESIAREHFPDESPLGRRLKNGNAQLEIVGVVGDIRRAALSDRPRADIYFPFARFADAQGMLFIRTTGDPLLAFPAVRTALRSIEPNIMLHRPRSMDEVASSSTSIAQLAMRLLAGFAAVALTLAAIGIYGVMAYSVRRRTRELGTRVALGASRADIIRLVMREGGMITVTGVVVGLLSGVLAARSLSAVLFGVPPSDPWSMLAAAAVLGLTAMAACYLPARRASRIDPARTLIE
jgi:putative ABC transport system permease protein